MGGLSLAMFWNSEKLSNFKAHKLSWTVNELCTRIPRVPSSCPPIAHIHRWTLRKNHPFAVFSSKCNTCDKKKKHTHKRQDNRDLKYQVIISNYNFMYAVISKFTFFKDVIITIIYKTKDFTNVLQKNKNQNMFCTKSRLLTQKTVLKVSLFQFFY